MDNASNTANKVVAWASIVVIGIVTTSVAIWFISQSQAIQDASWVKVIKYPGFIAGATATALLPWWVMACAAMDTNKTAQKSTVRKGPIDLVDVMLADRHHDERF
ncbi:MAG: hypothetical protein JKX85_13915 [Phycisphaeraceae bacterium]|nr:hypothetical protein [Phycisphaeraceae bacterium]